MKRISSFFYTHTNIWFCIAATLMMICYAALVMGGKSAVIMEQIEINSSVPGLWFGIEKSRLTNFFEALDQSGLATYKELISIWDMIFPLLYCSMYIFWISLIYKKINWAHKFFLNLFPIIPATLDWIENGLELNLLNQYLNHNIQDTTLQLANIINMSKWSMSYLNYTIIFLGMLLIARMKFLARKEN